MARYKVMDHNDCLVGYAETKEEAVAKRDLRANLLGVYPGSFQILHVTGHEASDAFWRGFEGLLARHKRAVGN